MHPTDPSQPLGERLQGTNLYLVGMMGCGKSTVGPLWPRRWATAFSMPMR